MIQDFRGLAGKTNLMQFIITAQIHGANQALIRSHEIVPVRIFDSGNIWNV